MPSKRLVQLDVLRGAAILLVAGHHYCLWGSPTFSWTRSGPGRHIARWLVDFGWSGVDLFFVLSGFLVGGLLLAEHRDRGSIDVGRFLVRRALKIWPAYFLLLAYAAMTGEARLGPNLIHLQNYLGCPTRLVHTWSLAVEEHFYLGLPILLVGLAAASKGRPVALPAVALAVMMISLVGRFLAFDRGQSPVWADVYIPTHFRIDALAFGVLLAHWHGSSARFRDMVASNRMTIAASGLLMLIPAMVFSTMDPTFATMGVTWTYIGYGGILIAAVSTPVDRGLGRLFFGGRLARTMASIGVASYSIYLWHMEFGLTPTMRLFEHWPWLSPKFAWWAGAATYSVLAIGSGMVLHRAIDAPMLVVREFLIPGRRIKAVEKPGIS